MKFIFLFLIIILNFSNCWNQDSKNPPEAVKGVIDLRNWDFNSKNNSRDNIIHLKGEWEFYWKKLCNPISIDKNNNSLKTNCFPTENDYLKVPGNWDRYISEGKEIGGKGFASYRLKVLLPPNFLEPLEIKIPNIGTAYNFWVNGELLGNAGIVSEIEDQGKMGHFPKVYLIQSKNFLKSENDQNYFNLQVDISNYHYYSGGFWYNVQLGNYNSVTTQMFYSELIDFLLMGSILLMGFYHIILFVLRKQDPSTFWLGLYCLPISIRMLLTGEKFLERHFPEYSQFFLFIEYLSLIFLVPIFLNFLYWLFPKLISNSLSKIITIGAYFLSLPIIILPSYYYTRILTIIQIYVIIAAILATNILFKALITKKQGAKIFFFGWIIFFIAIINDILYFQGFIQTGEFTPVGLLLIIFSQTIVLSLRFTGAFSEVENLSKELETINKSLEKKISERTKDLQEASSEIEELNKFTYIVNSLSDLDEIFTEISKHVYYKYGISAIWLFLPNKKKKYLYAYKAYSYERLPEDQYKFLMNKKVPLNEEGGILYKVFKKKRPFYISNIQKVKLDVDKEFVKILHLKSHLQIPLLNRNECIGILSFTNIGAEMKLNKKEINKLTNICSQISGSIKSAHLVDQLESQREDFNLLNLLLKQINETNDLDDIVEYINLYLKINYGFANTIISRYNKENSSLDFIAGIFPENLSFREKKLVRRFSLHLDLENENSIHKKSFDSKEPIFVAESNNDIFSNSGEILNSILKNKSWLTLPIFHQSKMLGTLEIFHTEQISLSREDIEKLKPLAEQLAGIINNAILYRELEEEKENALILKIEADAKREEAEILRKQADEQNKEIEKLAESRKRLSIVGQMVAGIVHDIKNPITSIMALTESIGSEKTSQRKREKYTASVIQEINKLTDLAYEILDFSKGKINLEVENVDVREFILDIYNLLELNFEYYSIIPKYDINFSGIVSFDPARMRRVLINLIKNSIEAMYDGKKNYFVKTTVKKEKNSILFIIEDNGPGLPEMIEEKIFEAFATEGKSRGTGLGLFMSKWIVETHGGSISYDTKKGEGTSFYISLPISLIKEEN